MIRMLLSFAFAGALAGCAYAAEPLNAGNYYNALKAAPAGEVMVLKGDFPKPINVPGLSNITIDASEATISSIKLEKATNVALRGGVYRTNAATPAGQGAIHVVKSAGVAVVGVEVDASQIMFRDSSDVSLTDATVTNAYVGVTGLNVDGMTVTNLTLWRMSGDGLNLWSVRNAKVAYVTCAGFKLRDPLHHPDCVQLANYASSPETQNVDIRFVMVSGETQGVAAFQTAGRYRDVAFDQVWVMGRNYPQGVALYDTDGARLTNATVVQVPGGRYGPWVNLMDATAVSKCGNRAIAADGKVTAIDADCGGGKLDELSAIFAEHTVAKVEPLKTKGRVIVDFKTPAEGQAALSAVLATVKAN